MGMGPRVRSRDSRGAATWTTGRPRATATATSVWHHCETSESSLARKTTTWALSSWANSSWAHRDPEGDRGLSVLLLSDLDDGSGGDAALAVVVPEDVVAGAFEAGFERQRSRQVAVAVADEDSSHGGLRPNRDGERKAFHVVEDVLWQWGRHELALVLSILRILHFNRGDVFSDARSHRVRR